jgi:hypothetical protein
MGFERGGTDMDDWLEKINPQTVDWLLEEDYTNSPIRFLTLRDILDRSSGDPELEAARAAMMQTGPIPAILEKQLEDGYWENSESFYNPKYFATSWQLIMLSQMGADAKHPKIQKSCEYILKNGIGKFGGFSVYSSQTGAVHCLQGNLTAALMDLGYRNDPRLLKAVDWMARSVTGDGFAPAGEKSEGDHYIRSGISAPGFPCSANDHQPCAWGAVKVARALSKIPIEERTIADENAIKYCLNFLLSVDPSTADYPHPYTNKTSGSWFKFGFPLFYVTDLLQNLETLVALGFKGDARLKNAIDTILQKRDENGRWIMEYTYNGKTWVEIEQKGKASKWVTLRAIRVIKGYYS